MKQRRNKHITLKLLQLFPAKRQRKREKSYVEPRKVFKFTNAEDFKAYKINCFIRIKDTADMSLESSFELLGLVISFKSLLRSDI